MGLREKFRLIRSARVVHSDRADDLAGRQGEVLALEVVLQVAARRGWSVFESRRVPATSGSGKREIDLILVTPHLVLSIEVKQWGGSIEDPGDGRWVQVTSQGVLRQHRDAFAEVSEKSGDLKGFLHRSGFMVPEHAFRALVVLTNPGLRIRGGLSGQPGIVRIGELAGMLPPLGDPNPEGFLAGLGRFLGLVKRIPPSIPDAEGVSRGIAALPGWDVVALHGGRILKGDLLTKFLALEGERTVSRQDAESIEIRAPRSWVFGWFQGLRADWVDSTGQRRTGRLVPGRALTIRLAGRREDAVVPLESVTRIQFGSSGAGSLPAPPPPLESYSPEQVIRGVVQNVAEFGAFVRVDPHRVGLLHRSKLVAAGISLQDLMPGAPLDVRVLRAYRKDGKERLELDLAGQGT